MCSFPDLEPVCCSMSSSNRCFLTCIQVSQEAGQVAWYSHLFQNFPQFVVIHTVKGFSVVKEAVEFFWNSLAFSMIKRMLAIWSLVPLPFLNPAWTSGSSQFMYFTRWCSSGREPASQCGTPKRYRFDPWVTKIPWRRKWLPTPVLLLGESHGQRSLVGYSP